MSNQPQAKKHNSALLDELMAEITPLEMAQTQAKMELAARIEDLMQAKGWKKKQLAEAVGKQPSEVTKWCSGTQNLTMDVLTEIAFALGVELSSLFSKAPQQAIAKNTFTVSSKAVASVIVLTPIGSRPAVSDNYLHIGKNPVVVYHTNYQA